MRFHLVYNGALPSAGNKAKPADVLRIRKKISPQLKQLWGTHDALRLLQERAVVERPGNSTVRVGHGLAPRGLADAYPQEFEYLAMPIRVGCKTYQPLVRQSLHLCAELSILFLRQDDPGALISQGGDLDGRLKTLLDALRMPSEQEQTANPPPEASLFCLLENDSLVSRLDIRTDRLLFPATEHQHEVHLVIEVSVKVLQISDYNLCLL